ncbi:MAG: hypothetical protein CVV27_03175 [Candidatus Melainabacteria bacterium HGW-Melainabacteria-1]|nr:MAG: hypothetical protein CVV27_03175 [Candidatus Melainabacteria bacterium HGW-Melainabacteria-1]
MKRILGLTLTLGLLLASPASALWELDQRAGEAGQLKGQRREIYSLALSRNGELLASGSLDGTTRVWDTRTWQLLYDLPGHSHSVGAVAISPDGKTLASGGLDAQIQLWDLSSGQQLSTLTQPSKGVLSLAFSPDGKTLATGDLDSQIRLYDSGTWQLLKTLSGHAGAVSSLAYSPDGLTLASVGFNELGIRLWRVADGQRAQTLIDHSEEVYAVCFSPDGKYLASAGADKLIRLWDARTLLPVSRMAGHLAPIWSLAFSPDSQMLASGSLGDRTLRLWSVPQGANVQTLVKTSDKAFSLVFSPDGQALYSGHNDASVRVWHQDVESPIVTQPQSLQVAIAQQSWREAGSGDRVIAAGERGELLLSLENTGPTHLNQVTATVRIKTPGVRLTAPAQDFFIARFEAGSRKHLPLPLNLSPQVSADALELEIRLSVGQPEGQSLLPLRVPLTNGAP